MGIELTPQGKSAFADPCAKFTIDDFMIRREGMRRYRFYYPYSKLPIAIFDGDERSSEALKAMKMLLITRRLTK